MVGKGQVIVSTQQKPERATKVTFEDFDYVFLLTYARSGSTLLQSLLNSEPTALIRGENNNALFYMFKALEAVTMSKTQHGQHPTEPDTPWFGAEKLTPLGFKRTILRQFVNGVLRPTPTAKVLGFKEIRHIPFFMNDLDFENYCQFLLNSFPNAKLIFNSRDAEDVRKSAWLKELNPELVKRGVRAADERFRLATARFDNVLHLQYEDYVENHDEVKKLFKFVGFEYDAARVEAIFNKRLTHAKLTD